MERKKTGNKKKTSSQPLPSVPLTLDGWYILHQMFRIRWSPWKALPEVEREAAIAEARAVMEKMERREEGQSALFSLLGHKGDLMVLHFRRTLEQLNDSELRLADLKLAEYLEETTSYLSVLELGLYQATAILYPELKLKGLDPGSPEWGQAVEADLAERRKALAPGSILRSPLADTSASIPWGEKGERARTGF